VLLETSKGDLVIDLYTEECPLASSNFLKLCKCACGNVPTSPCVVAAKSSDPSLPPLL